MLEKRTREFQRRSRRLHKLSAAYSYAHLFVGGECRELDGAAAEEWASDEEAASARGSGSLSPLSASASQRLGGLSPVAPNVSASADAEQHEAALLISPVVCEHNVSTWGTAPASYEEQLLLKRLSPHPDADAAGGSTQCAQAQPLEELELTHADKDAFVVHVRPHLTCRLCLVCSGLRPNTAYLVQLDESGVEVLSSALADRFLPEGVWACNLEHTLPPSALLARPLWRPGASSSQDACARNAEDPPAGQSNSAPLESPPEKTSLRPPLRYQLSKNISVLFPRSLYLYFYHTDTCLHTT